MALHFHVWTRSGRVFRFHAHPYASRSHASKVAAKLRPDKADRLVLQCEACPPTQRSRRRPPRWAKVAAEMAAALGADPADVRRALDAALEHEKAAL